MTIRSKYNSRCCNCGGAIFAGELIDWDRSMGASHRSCPSPRQLATEHELAQELAELEARLTVDYADHLLAEYEAARPREYTAAALTRGSRDVSRDNIPGVPRLSLVELAEQCIRGSR